MSTPIKTSKISTLIENLQDILETEGDIPVVMSRDEEGNDFNTFDPQGDTSYSVENGLLILYPSSERCDLEDIEGYTNDRDDETYDDYDEDNPFDEYDLENDCYD
jgi:hypothetical protein